MRLLEAGVRDRLCHGHVAPAGAIAHEAHRALVDMISGLRLRAAIDLGLEAPVGIVLAEGDAGGAILQAVGNFAHRVANRRDDAHAGDYHPAQIGAVNGHRG